MDLLGQTLFQFVVEIIIFFLLMAVGIFIFDKIKKSDNRFFNPLEFLPEDEIHTLKQVFYLVVVAACFINVIYSLTFSYEDIFYFTVFDLFLSLFIAISLDKASLINKALILLLVPYGSLSYLLFGFSLVSIVDFIHVPVFIYFMKFYYDRFKEYTTANGLGIAIILLFVIIFVSFLVTQIVEGVNPLDSMVMVSNAFTSNGYAVLGHSIPGKLNSIFLVWGGYIISGAGTATLTAAILIKKFNKRIEQLEKLIEEESAE